MGAAPGQVAVNGGPPSACTVDVADDGVRIGGDAPALIVYDEIDDLLDSDYTLTVTTAGGTTYALTMLGRAYGQIAADVTKRRDESLEKNLLLRGVNLRDTYPGVLLGESEMQATFRMYEDLLVVRPDHGVMFGVPYSSIDRVEWDPSEYRATIGLDDGTAVTVAKLAKRSEEFVGELRRLLDALAARTRQTLSVLLPGLSGETLSALATLMRDGRAVQKRAVDAIDPALWPRLADAVLGARRDSYEHLAALAPDGWAAFGVKAIKAASEDEPEPVSEDAPTEDGAEAAGPAGDGTNRLWFFCPLTRDGAPVNAVAMEVTSESGHATYVFRLMEPERFAALSGEDLAGEVARSIGRLNRALLLLNFRREPLFASEEEILSGRFTRYRAALRLLPYLRWARESFLGRAAHTGGWEAAVQRIVETA